MSDTQERSKTIELVEPITFDGRITTSITLRPPKTGERRQAEGHLRSSQSPENYTRFGVALVAKCADVKEAVIDQMYDDEFMVAWEWVAGFLAGGRTAGNS